MEQGPGILDKELGELWKRLLGSLDKGVMSCGVCVAKGTSADMSLSPFVLIVTL